MDISWAVWILVAAILGFYASRALRRPSIAGGRRIILPVAPPPTGTSPAGGAPAVVITTSTSTLKKFWRGATWLWGGLIFVSVVIGGLLWLYSANVLKDLSISLMMWPALGFLVILLGVVNIIRGRSGLLIIIFGMGIVFLAGTATHLKTNFETCFSTRNCDATIDGLPVVNGDTQTQPYKIPDGATITFYAVGDDVTFYYGVGYCVEVLPKSLPVSWEDYEIGVGHIYPVDDLMTKVTVISKTVSQCSDG